MSYVIFFPDKFEVLCLGKGQWQLTHDYVVPVFDKTNAMVVPAGFTTDMASVPKPFRSLIDRTDCGSAAPLAHDFLYQHGGCYLRLHDAEHPCLSRRRVDGLFRWLMGLEGVPAWRRTVAWLAVRLAGWACWHRSKKGTRSV